MTRRAFGWAIGAGLVAAVAGCAAGSLATPAAPVQPLSNLISQEDYPAAARRYELEGRTSVVLSVNADGRVSGCRVATSSGHAVLDRATCGLLQRRARFTAARDRKGEAVASEYPAVVRWVLPAAARPAG